MTRIEHRSPLTLPATRRVSSAIKFPRAACSPGSTGGFRRRRFRWAKMWRRKSNRWAACCCNFIAPSTCCTAKAPRANSRNGWRAGWIWANPRELIELQRSRRLQKRCAAGHPARYFAHGKRPQHHRTGFRSRRHRADGLAEPNLFRIGQTLRQVGRAQRCIGGADGMCADLKASLATPSTCTSSFPRRPRRIGRKCSGCAQQLGADFTVHDSHSRFRRRRRGVSVF